MNKILISMLLNVFLFMQANAFPVDGKKINIAQQDVMRLNQSTCSAYGGVEKYEAWEFPFPDSYVSSRVYCNLIKADDGYLRRNVFDCNNQNGKWECDLIATELKYILPAPIDFILLSSTYLLDVESTEVINQLIAQALDKKMYHEASCSVERSAKNKDLYVVQCNYKNYVEILKSCDNTACRWAIVNAGNVFN